MSYLAWKTTLVLLLFKVYFILKTVDYSVILVSKTWEFYKIMFFSLYKGDWVASDTVKWSYRKAPTPNVLLICFEL